MTLRFDASSAAAHGGERGGLAYIPAIDGMRAIAVASVVLYHLWSAALPGGYAGVDVFFVISGFVVTGSIRNLRFVSLRQLSAHFYARRLVRILPALALMLVVMSLATALFVPRAWLSGGTQNTARAAFFGLSNIALATGSGGYFDVKSSFNPFTHTWSLGVEEQFYLIFPFLIYWHQRLARDQGRSRRVLLLVASLSAASLVAHGVLNRLDPALGFYLVVSRFWELGAGMMLCLTVDDWRSSPRLTGAVGLAGIALIALSLGLPVEIGLLRNLLAVAGAVALIAHVTARGQAPVGRLLASGAMTWLGKRSYALYLWHWPVFTLFRWTTGLSTPALGVAALAISLALAALSYALVENPIHRGKWVAAQPRGRVIAAALVATLLMAGLSDLISLAHNRLTLSRTGNALDWYADADRPLDPARSHCTVRASTEVIAGGQVTTWKPEGCAPAGHTVFVAGDSHAVAYSPALRQLVAETGVTVQLWYNMACPPLRLIKPLSPSAFCQRYFGTMFPEIGRRATARDTVFMPGLRIDRLSNQFDNDPTVHAEDRGASPLGVAQAYDRLPQLVRGGARLIMEAPMPVFPSPTFRCADWFNRNNPSCAGGITIGRARIEKRRAPIVAAMHGLAATVPHMRIWDPLPILCGPATCEAIRDGRPLFFDGDHLSGYGNDFLYPALKQLLADRGT
jgi:peptidoglycan/LPS O-acetylase OafA/YrhL